HISKARYLLKESWPLMVSGLVVMVYMKIDQIMIKEMMNTTAVGIYSAAMRLSEAWYFVPMLISQSLFPAILSAKKSDEALYKLRLQRLLNLMMFFSLVIAIIFTFLSDWIINFLYGPSFDGAGDILSIQVWAGVAVSSGVVSSNWFLIEGLQKYSMYRTSVGAVINVILNLILIPLYGIAGSAVATLISQFVASVLLNAFFSSTRVIFKLQTRAILGIGLLGNREPV
ncbi:flippase, partial [Pontibacter rugosus]